MKPEEIYAGLLKDQESASSTDLETQEAKQHDFGDWRFFVQKHKRGGGPGAYRNHAAINSAGEYISPRLGGNGWHAFLTAEAIDPVFALDKLSWMLRSIPLSKQPHHETGSDTEAAKRVTDPSIEKKDDGTVVFKGWIATPPNADDAMLLTISAPPTGKAEITQTPWAKVEPGQ